MLPYSMKIANVKSNEKEKPQRMIFEILGHNSLQFRNTVNHSTLKQGNVICWKILVSKMTGTTKSRLIK